MLYDPAPRLFLKALLDSTRRLLQGPRGELFRRDVLDTFLPNLLGIAGGLKPKSASDVLGNERPQFEQFLRQFDAGAMLPWVAS
jgi:hypothetical protein